MLDFFKGERKYIRARVVPLNCGEIVVITSANYALLDGEKILESGICTIDRDTIAFLISTDTEGCYTLKLTCTVGPETIIQKTTVAVKK